VPPALAAVVPDPGTRPTTPLLNIAQNTTLGTFVVFCTTALVNEPVTAVALVAILALALPADLPRKRTQSRAK
jgi:hypothetical protein